jgi:glycosyltransferase involved in cell wall biosynthesis/predicted Zn-dependent protease
MARVSLCLIVKNEEANLPACLESARGLCDEIVVVDTGSTDRTKEIAVSFGARVFDFPWCDDFSAARNESLRHATGDWIFWLDADDRLDEPNRQKLRKLFESLPDENACFLMRCLSLPNEATGVSTAVDHARLFRNHPEVRWRYRVHEQITPALEQRGAAIRRTDVVVQHAGYRDPRLRRLKDEDRNLRLLRLDLAEHPDDAVVLFHLGMTLGALGRNEEALPVLQRSLERTKPADLIARRLYSMLAQVHRRLGRTDDALAVCTRGRERYPNDASLLFQEGLLRHLLGDLVGAEVCLLRLLAAPPDESVAMVVDPDMAGVRARFNLAVIYRDQGRLAEAETQWRAVLAERPGQADAWIGLADLHAAAGRWGELERTAAALQADPARPVEAALVRSRLHLARKEFATARAVLEEAAARAPQALGVRVALTHVLLTEGGDPTALERALNEVLDLDPGNVQVMQNLRAMRARQARPGRPRTARVSLTMIVKNEEKSLAGCLESARGLFDEIVVVDTGSTDRTKEIASRFGARVFDFPWCDDFSAARNESLKHASGDWVFWLDADDRLDDDNRTRLRNLFDSLKDENVALMMKCVSPGRGASLVEVDHARLFRRHPEVRWQGRVHEQILAAVERLGGVVRWTDVVIHHLGYRDPEVDRGKNERNVRLLELEHRERPDDPVTLFHLGWTYQLMGRVAEAVPLLRRSLERSHPRSSFLRKIYRQLGRALQQVGQTAAALAVCRQGRARYPDDPELLFLEGCLLMVTQDLAAAERCFLRLLELPEANYFAVGVDRGLRGHKARHNLALLCLHQGRSAEAEAHWSAAVAAAPDFTDAWLGLADLYLRQGRNTDAEQALRAAEADPRHAARVAALRRASRRPEGAQAPPVAHTPGSPQRKGRPRVSLCMIAKDEEANLPACLESAAGLFDEIIVVDTGSTDRTKEIAAGFGARVVDFAWCDDFSAARNESLKHASGDWVFWLDADDRLDEENRHKLRSLFESLGDELAAYLMKCHCLADLATGSSSVVDHARLFRRHPQVRWEYRVHEQIVPAVQRRGGELRRSDVVIRHTGYVRPEHRQAKNERYLRLLEREDAERPDDSVTLFNLGWTRQKMGRMAESVGPLRRSLELAARGSSIVPKLHVLLARAYLHLGRPREAVEVCRAGWARCPGDAELLFQEALALHDAGDPAGAETRLRQLLALPSGGEGVGAVDAGLRDYKARHHLALALRAQGKSAEAETLWRQVLAEQPGFDAGWVALADLYLAGGRWDELERLVQRLAADPGRAGEAAVLRARGLAARKQFAEARRLLEETAARHPQALWPRVALSHVLLQEGRDWAAAAKALRDVLALDPANSEAHYNLGLLRARGHEPPTIAGQPGCGAEKPDL